MAQPPLNRVDGLANTKVMEQRLRFLLLTRRRKKGADSTLDAEQAASECGYCLASRVQSRLLVLNIQDPVGFYEALPVFCLSRHLNVLCSVLVVSALER